MNKKYESLYRSRKKIYSRVSLELHKEYDADILARLDGEKSKQGFFKTAAREKIERERKEKATR